MTVSIQSVDREAWQCLASSFSDYNYRQLWDFGMACADRLGAICEHVAVYDGADIIGLADVRIKRIPLLKTGIAYINGGPLVLRNLCDTVSSDSYKACLQALVRRYVNERQLVLRILPPVGPSAWNELRIQLFCASGFSLAHSLKPYRTFMLDLTPSLDDLRKKLDPKWRNNLKRAEKATDVLIRKETSVTDFEHFERLYAPFIRRKKFDIDLTPSFYREVQKQLSEKEKFQILLCEYNGGIIAGHISSLLGNTAVNIFRANSEAALELRTGYCLQWEGVRYAKEAGLKWYDLGGIDPDNNPGVYAFKKGMGGVDTTAPGPFEYYPGRLKKTLIFRGEQMYRYLKRFMKR
jgi:hypothetical protein